ncbi:MAG: DNA translocase FtsK 4TM domain-containing protein [Calditrichia bacterium]
MAKRKAKQLKLFSRKRSSKKNTPADGNNEIYGLLTIAFGAVFAGSLATYHADDPTFWSAGTTTVKNLFRIVGASIAEPVFQGTLGYASLIFPLIIIVVGFAIAASYPLIKLKSLGIRALAWAFLGALVLAMPESLETLGRSRQYYPSGLLGGITTDAIARYMGRGALVFIVFIYFFVLLMITFRFRISTIPIYIVALFQQMTAQVTGFFSELFNWGRSVQQRHTGGEKVPLRERITGRLLRDDDLEDDELFEPPMDDGLDFEPVPPAKPARRKPKIDEPPPFDENFQSYEEPPLPPEPVVPPVKKPAKPPAPPAPIIEAAKDESSYQLPERPPEPATELPPTSPTVQQTLDIDNEPIVEEEVIDYDEQVQAALAKFEMPPMELLHEDETESAKVSREELMANADLLENTLAQFGVKAFVKKVIEGPVITLYAVRPAEGVKINQVVSLADDLALAMRAKGIRMIAPIPGEAAIGIEIPNRRPSTVYLKSIMRSEKIAEHKGQLVIGMGKTIGGDVFCADLTRMPHLLIAGSTGSGKSVGVNTMIASILCRVPPSDVKFVMIDPKKLELSLYAKLKDHYLAICPDLDEIVITHPQNAIMILRSVVLEMEERYDTLAKVGVRDIVAYNQKLAKLETSGKKPEGAIRLPYIIVIIDELADLILTASREVEEPITRLAQMARAVGIHLIVATQRPSVDIITGLIKANFPTRIAYQVATRPDSKVILDIYGAEKLIGNGDMLFLPPGTGKPVRLQNPFVSTEEVERLISHIRKQPKFPPYELKLVKPKSAGDKSSGKKAYEQDEFYDKAKEIVVRHQQGSISLLQRKLKVGYARAARLIDELEEGGVVGPGQGSKARDVLISSSYDT